MCKYCKSNYWILYCSGYNALTSIGFEQVVQGAEMYIKHGNENILVLHGGPGAIGGARNLAKNLNAVEVLSYGRSIQAQLNEIIEVIKELGLVNPIIIGHSWGAWLAYLFAAKCSMKYSISKVVLIGCGAFDESYLHEMQKRRYDKLTVEEEREANVYFSQMSQGNLQQLSRFNELMCKMDAYEMNGHELLDSFDYDGHQMLMNEIKALRSSGELIEVGKELNSELILFHGVEDPHPLRGVTEPFDRAGIAYKLYAFDNCGHTPWHEKYAYESFYQLLKKELD